MRLGGVAVALMLLAGCSAVSSPTASIGSPAAASSTPSTSASPSIAPAPSGTTLLHDGTLQAGVTYATAGFAHRFVISVPPRTPNRFWFATETAFEHALIIGNPEFEGVGAAFYLPTGGFDYDGSPAGVPPDFVKWLMADPHLTIVKREGLRVGGQPAVALTLSVRVATITKPSGLCHTASAQCVLIASTTPDAPFRPLLEYPGEEPIVVVVTLPDGQMLINEDAGVTQARAKALVATLRFLP